MIARAGYYDARASCVLQGPTLSSGVQVLTETQAAVALQFLATAAMNDAGLLAWVTSAVSWASECSEVSK